MNKTNNKIKVNVYLCHPTNVYYEMMIQPTDLIGNLLIYLRTALPKNKFIFNTENPFFFDMDSQQQLDPSKSFVDQNIGGAEFECSIKIKLKVSRNDDIA